MVGNDLEKRGTRVTVQNVHSHVEAPFLQLVLVGRHALNSLLTKLAEQLVLLLRVDRQRTRDPRAAENVGGKHSRQEDVAALRDSLVVQQVIKGLVAGLGAVESKQDLALVVGEVLTRNTDADRTTRSTATVGEAGGLAAASTW